MPLLSVDRLPTISGLYDLNVTQSLDTANTLWNTMTSANFLDPTTGLALDVDLRYGHLYVSNPSAVAVVVMYLTTVSGAYSVDPQMGRVIMPGEADALLELYPLGGATGIRRVGFKQFIYPAQSYGLKTAPQVLLPIRGDFYQYLSQ